MMMNEILKYIAFLVFLAGTIIFIVCSAVGKYPDLKRYSEFLIFGGLLAALFGK